MEIDQHIIDLIPAYALNCLDEEDVQIVADHLAICESCRAELREYEEITAQLATAVLAVEPPPIVKSRIMTQVGASNYSRPKFNSRRTEQKGFGRSFLRFSPAWTAASLVLVLLLAVSNILMWNQVRSLREEVQSVPLQVVALSGSQVAPQATGMIVISKDGRHGTLVVDELPVLDQSMQYQLWLIKDGNRTSGGVFSVSKDGYGSVWVSSPQPLADYSAFGVTKEPEGGSPSPTGENVLAGRF
jgi:anti-sigma-K factor RskA